MAVRVAFLECDSDLPRDWERFQVSGFNIGRSLQDLGAFAEVSDVFREGLFFVFLSRHQSLHDLRTNFLCVCGQGIKERNCLVKASGRQFAKLADLFSTLGVTYGTESLLELKREDLCKRF